MAMVDPTVAISNRKTANQEVPRESASLELGTMPDRCERIDPG